jgi:hypothetical protein
MQARWKAEETKGDFSFRNKLELKPLDRAFFPSLAFTLLPIKILISLFEGNWTFVLFA